MRRWNQSISIMAVQVPYTDFSMPFRTELMHDGTRVIVAGTPVGPVSIGPWWPAASWMPWEQFLATNPGRS